MPSTSTLPPRPAQAQASKMIAEREMEYRGESQKRLMSSRSRDNFQASDINGLSCLTIILFGATGDLAKKKTYPALFKLYKRGLLPRHFQIFGVGRGQKDIHEFKKYVKGLLKGDGVDEFVESCSYFGSKYHEIENFETLLNSVKTYENQNAPRNLNIGRLMYLAIPPTNYVEVLKVCKKWFSDIPEIKPKSFIRCIIEKPFGKDLYSSEELQEQISKLFDEDTIYRIDHYLGKEMSINLFAFRFANTFIMPLWNRNYISNVTITLKETFGTYGRAQYFDEFGIIRDVMQNHLLQILLLTTMERPVSMHPDDVRDEKLKILRQIPPIRSQDVIIGQYTANEETPGYMEDPGVKKDSKSPTFASIRMSINNERWEGVPFILRAGKALNESLCQVRVQLRETPGSLFGDSLQQRNEIVIRLQPDEAIFMKFINKKPGIEMETDISELDLTYKNRYHNPDIPEAYERLINDAIRGDQQHFVRDDELQASWAIFTPILQAIDKGQIPLTAYKAGTRGPPDGDEQLARAGYIKNRDYKWQAS